MKKILSLLLSTIIIISLCTPMLAFADNDSQADVVFVIDDTKSMKYNDPSKLTAKAVTKYIDLVSGYDGRVGIVTFANKVLSQKNLTNIKTNNNTVADYIKKNIKQNGSCTNCAKGIQTAVSMLESSRAEKRAIVLITDGEYDFDATKTASEEQQLKDAQKLLKSQLSIAKKSSIKIHTIKIEAKNSKKTANDGKVDFKGIQTATNGNRRIAQNAKDIEKYIKEIRQALYPEIKDGEEKEVPLYKNKKTSTSFKVPSGTTYVNIQIDHKFPLSIASLKDSKSKKVGYEKSNRDGYTNIRIESPKAGKITMTILSKQSQTIKIHFASAGALSIVSDVSAPLITTKKHLEVTASLFDNKKLITDIGSSLIVSAIIKDSNGNELSSELMTQASDGVFTYTADTIEIPGDYYVAIRIDDSAGKEKLVGRDMMFTIEKAKLHPVWIILICLVSLIVLAGLVVLIILFLKNKAKLSGSIQYNYTCTSPSTNDRLLQSWNLKKDSKKRSCVNIYTLMGKPKELKDLQAIKIFAKGNVSNPTLFIKNNNSNINVTLNSKQISKKPTQLISGNNLEIIYKNGTEHRITAKIL